MKTWWVEFEWTCMIYDPEENEWFEDDDCDACRFQCLKKNIPEEVRKHVEEELEYEKYKGLKINISDCYQTTDCEV